MDKKLLKSAFDRLIMVWESENNLADLGPLTDKDLDFFIDFQTEVHKQETENTQKSDPKLNAINKELQSNACEMVNFVINDLLDIRVEKILNNCRTQNRIEETLMTSSEIEFYRNLMTAFKGYKKIRNVYDSITEICKPEVKPVCDPVIGEIEETKPLNTPLKLEYIAFFALDEISPLKGIDFLNYGPYKKEDIGILPRVNAQILEKEKLIKII